MVLQLFIEFLNMHLFNINAATDIRTKSSLRPYYEKYNTYFNVYINNASVFIFTFPVSRNAAGQDWKMTNG